MREPRVPSPATSEDRYSTDVEAAAWWERMRTDPPVRTSAGLFDPDDLPDPEECS